jgi:hypothetical protein
MSAAAPSLGAALTARWAVEDCIPLALVTTMHLCWLALSHRLLQPREVAVVLLLGVLELGTLALGAARPSAYRRLRLPMIAAVRCFTGAVPLLISVASVISRDVRGSACSAAVDGSGSAAAGACSAYSLAASLRAAGQLLSPVAWIHSLFLAPLALQLPPLAHLIVHNTAMLLLMRRTPAGEALRQKGCAV